MDEREMSKEKSDSLPDAAHERARKELKKYFRKAAAVPPPRPVDWEKALARHEAAIQAIQRAREAGRARRGEQ